MFKLFLALFMYVLGASAGGLAVIDTPLKSFTGADQSKGKLVYRFRPDQVLEEVRKSYKSTQLSGIIVVKMPANERSIFEVYREGRRVFRRRFKTPLLAHQLALTAMIETHARFPEVVHSLTGFYYYGEYIGTSSEFTTRRDFRYFLKNLFCKFAFP
jgi:tryptophan synthase alpha subunit